MEILITIVSISGIATLLAILIVLADKFLNNYGQCNISINNGDKTFVIQGGQNLLSSLAEQKIYIPSACGGKATCGLCKVKVVDGAGPLLPTEEPFLTEQEKLDGVRLSCQVKIKRDISILIPEEYFSIKQYKATVMKINDMTHDIKEFSFRLDEPTTIDFKAGQYMQIETKPYGKIKEKAIRAYSISSSPSDKNHIELIVRRVQGGICTTYMHDYLNVGDQVILTGPQGDFYRRDDSESYIFMAGGSGLAPIKSIIMDIVEKGLDKEMYFFFGAVTKKDLYYIDYFTQLEKDYPKFHYIPALSGPLPEDDWKGDVGLVTNVMLQHIKDGSEMHAYLCGSPGMINACIKVLTGVSFREDKIFYDKF